MISLGLMYVPHSGDFASLVLVECCVVFVLVYCYFMYSSRTMGRMLLYCI